MCFPPANWGNRGCWFAVFIFGYDIKMKAYT